MNYWKKTEYLLGRIISEMFRLIGLFIVVLFAYWFDRHYLHLVDTLFSQVSLKQILLYFSKLLKELANSLG